jgi:predicted nucleic acid-binding protein
MNQSLLDTDILSAFLRGHPAVSEKFNSYLKEFHQINMSIISYYEILNGLYYKDAKNQMEGFMKFVSFNKVIPLTVISVEISAKIFADLRKSGQPIGHTDTLIAGIAIENDMQLVTNNTSHFNRILNLSIANWME